MVTVEGLEPPTKGLKGPCSAIELHGQLGQPRNIIALNIQNSRLNLRNLCAFEHLGTKNAIS